MKLSRRAVLLSTSAIIVSPLMSVSPVRAEAGIAIAAIGLVNSALEFLKRSGDMERELEAVQLKLDAILLNQKLMMNAIVLLNDSLANVLSKLKDIPSEVLTLDAVVDARSIAAELADKIEARISSDSDDLRKEYEAIRQRIKQLSYRIDALATETTRPPQLLIGAKHLLHAIVLLSRFDDLLGSKSPATIQQNLSSARSLENALEIMTGPLGIDVRIEESARLIMTKAAAIIRDPFGKLLLPSDFAEPAGMNALSDATPARQLDVCLMTTAPVDSKPMRPRLAPVTGGDGQPSMDSPGTIETESKSATRISYNIAKKAAYGGRKIYSISRSEKKTWGQRQWTRVTQVDARPKVLSSSPASIIEGCHEFPDGPNGSDPKWSTFTRQLDDLAAHIAIESRLQALRDGGVRNLKKCRELVALFRA